MVGCFDDLEDKLFMLKTSLVCGVMINLIYRTSAPVGEDGDVSTVDIFSQLLCSLYQIHGSSQQTGESITVLNSAIKMNRVFVTSAPRQSSNIYRLATP